MKVTSKLRYARISPQKTRMIVDMIRGSDVLAAERLVKFLPQKAAKIVSKVLDSAIANAENNLSMDINRLKVTRAFADDGPMVKRIRARARGRVSRINRRTCHITVEVEEAL